MALFAFRKGHRLRIHAQEFVILQKLPQNLWQLQDTSTGEWREFSEHDLLDRFANKQLSFVANDQSGLSAKEQSGEALIRHLSTYPPKLIEMARIRLEYLKEVERQQPIAITQEAIEPLARAVSERIKDTNPPGWRTICRSYRRWVAAGRDIRAIIPRHSSRGPRAPRLPPEVRAISEQVIQELYMTPERKRVPEVLLGVIRRVHDSNRFRDESDRLPIPSRSTLYREVAKLPAYEVMAARYGKRRANMEFRVSTNGPHSSRALERVVMDHTAADMIVVDDNSMLPLGRPTITSALDEHTRCPTGFYTGFEPPSCLAVMRCFKHAILPKTYVSREFPSIKNRWECYGVPELIVVDNSPEFHSIHFERACLHIGVDIQYAKVLVPWYKGKLERFQGTMNHDLLHGEPGTTFSNILERDEYDPTKEAVVLLSTFREMLHKWIIDIHLQAPHRGINDIPAHRWHSEISSLPPPLPPSANELDILLGMTAQRVVFHYGIELEGLKYNSVELGALRRRMGGSVKVEVTFDPGDLSNIHVLDPQTEAYIAVPALNQSYAKGLSLWQHKVIRRYARSQLNGRTDLVALAQAKAEIRALVERDFQRKSTRGRQRHARFLQDHTQETFSERVTTSPQAPFFARELSVCPKLAEENADSQLDVFDDDNSLPELDAGLDLPYSSGSNRTQ